MARASKPKRDEKKAAGQANGDDKKTNLPARIGNFQIAIHGGDVLAEIIRENLGGSQITEFDLDRITVPTGGTTSFIVPSLDGDDEVKEIEGVVVHWTEPRGYWKESFDDNPGQPPDCSSPDSLTGFGDPGGDCSECPLAQFETADKGSGQACKQMRMLFLVRQSDMLPIVISCPPTSLAGLRRYFLRLSNNMTLFYGVVTKLTLKQAQNKAGVKYSEIVAASAGRLNSDEMDAIKAYKVSIQASMERVKPQTGDFDGS